MRNIFFNWQISDHYGWGIYGLHLFLLGRNNSLFNVAPIIWPPSFLHEVDPLSQLQFAEYENIRKQLVPNDGDVLLTAIGNEVKQQKSAKALREIGVTFFESNPLPLDQILAMKKFESIITGSSWNHSQLDSMGVHSKLIYQGVDRDLFRVQHKRYFKDRFVVFSGGKLEFRKGQDIALKAFSIFSKKYPEALLISCWDSPWNKIVSPSINHSNLCLPLSINEKDVNQAIDNWISSNGVSKNQTINLGSIPNRLMPDIFREVDLGVFTNRCEGGTNLVLMEAMSSGVPCAISANTGHLDLIQKNNCLPLKIQGSIDNAPYQHSTLDWGESSVDELVAIMEDQFFKRAYLDPLIIRDSVKDFSWSNTVNSLLDFV